MSEIKQVWGIIKDYKCADLKIVQDPALAVFQHQQAKIEKLENELSTTKQVLGNVIDMEVAKVDNLKAQLNNMETCYIEKKKEVEGQQKRIDEYKKLTTSIRNEFDLWSDDSEFADVVEAQIENLEALRGAND